MHQSMSLKYEPSSGPLHISEEKKKELENIDWKSVQGYLTRI